MNQDIRPNTCRWCGNPAPKGRLDCSNTHRNKYLFNKRPKLWWNYQKVELEKKEGQ